MPVAVFHTQRQEITAKPAASASQQFVELFQTGGYLVTQMHPQYPAATFSQHLKIPLCLGRLDHTKGIVPPRHLDIHSGISRDLQKYTGIRPAFIGLPG